MAKSITQEQFNDAVRANIKKLRLSPEAAVTETVARLESQGVNLRLIVKEPPEYFQNIKEVIAGLANLNKPNAIRIDVIRKLIVIKIECDKGLEYRVLIADFGAYPVLLDTLSNEREDDARRLCLKALISIMDRQPDLLDNRGLEILRAHLTSDFNLETRRLTLKWARVCCIMHEANRQKLFNIGILEPLKELLNEDFAEIMKETLALCRALVLDDDVRVEFGKAHEHSKLVANDTLCSLITLLFRLRTNELLVHDLLTTLCVLLVRVEYCKKVVDGGALNTIKEILTTFDSNEKINKQCFKVLKALACDDQCKVQIINHGFAPVLSKSLDLSAEHMLTATAGLACVAALCLRSPDNSEAFFESGMPEVIVNIMKLYPDEKIVQKNASWAVRNMVCRNKDQRRVFLDLGIEELLEANLKKFKDIKYDIKAAIRDLGCNIYYEEE